MHTPAFGALAAKPVCLTWWGNGAPFTPSCPSPLSKPGKGAKMLEQDCRKPARKHLCPRGPGEMVTDAAAAAKMNFQMSRFGSRHINEEKHTFSLIHGGKMLEVLLVRGKSQRKAWEFFPHANPPGGAAGVRQRRRGMRTPLGPSRQEAGMSLHSLVLHG